MAMFAALDVGHKRSAVCIVYGDGAIVWRGFIDTHPQVIGDALAPFAGRLEKVGLESSSLSPWLYHELEGFCFPVVCMVARRCADVLQARDDVFDYVERFYNPDRRHKTIGYLSPMRYEERAMDA